MLMNQDKPSKTFVILIKNPLIPEESKCLLACTSFISKEDKIKFIHIYNLPLSKKPLPDKNLNEVKLKEHQSLLSKPIEEYCKLNNIPRDSYEIIMKLHDDKKLSIYELYKSIISDMEDENKLNMFIYIGYHGVDKGKDIESRKSFVKFTDFTKYIGTSFLINSIELPVFLIKNYNSRFTNPDSNFKWIVFIKSGDNVSFYVLIKLLKFVDIKCDEIYGFHISSEVERNNDIGGIYY